MLIWLDGGGNRVKASPTRTSRASSWSCSPSAWATTPRRTCGRPRGRSPAGRSTSRPPARRSSRSATTRGPKRCSARPSTTRRAWWTGCVGMPVSPRFLATRVWTRFVSDTPPDPATLGTLVRAYGADHDITALVRAAARAPAFRDPGSVLVREPVLWLTAGVARAERARDEGARRTARGGADRPGAGAVRAAERGRVARGHPLAHHRVGVGAAQPGPSGGERRRHLPGHRRPAELPRRRDGRRCSACPPSPCARPPRWPRSPGTRRSSSRPRSPPRKAA